ncbi:MAG: hypothetical protein FWG14_02810 [Peptococcaceae bacterium]|nr:hypothetical protein [Peptococcaceae bacterium]
MAGFGFLILLLWEIILVAFSILVILQGRKGMVLCCVLLLAGSVSVVTMGAGGPVPWGRMAAYVAVLAMGLGVEAWIKRKSDVQGVLRLEAGVVGMVLLVALGWAMLPLALVAGALCGGLILRRYVTPGLSRWLIVLGVERMIFSGAWLVLGNLI